VSCWPGSRGLQRQLDELKKVAAQPGPQGPPGPPGKLPCVKEYLAERVHYEADVVTHAGALWQARCDTVHAPPHDDWVCLAQGGRDGLTPTIRGTYDVHEDYKMLDVVAFDGASFIASKDDPGICPGPSWQPLSKQGKPGRSGETGAIGPRGAKGERGEAAPIVASWYIDRERYRAIPFMTDGSPGPELNLRPLFEAYFAETAGGV
jgi:hypothetical protein